MNNTVAAPASWRVGDDGQGDAWEPRGAGSHPQQRETRLGGILGLPPTSTLQLIDALFRPPARRL